MSMEDNNIEAERTFSFDGKHKHSHANDRIHVLKDLQEDPVSTSNSNNSNNSDAYVDEDSDESKDMKRQWQEGKPHIANPHEVTLRLRDLTRAFLKDAEFDPRVAEMNGMSITL